jgi:hypothetical protein
MSLNSRNQGFPFYFCLLNDRRIRIQEAKKLVDPVHPDSDPDTQQ